MTDPERERLRLHEDPILFREAVEFTAAETRLASRLLEKDYFCTVVLQHMADSAPDLVFRGGTCLAKVHAGFYRLSEDLDFLISTPVDASRGERRSRVEASRAAVAEIGGLGLRIVSALTGANDSRQYAGTVGYTSLLGDHEEQIKVEIGLREPLLVPAVTGEARTLLLDPVSREAMAPAVPMPCVSRVEAFSEKARAALSRREVAIRDFYDMDHAVRGMGLRLDDLEFVDLVKRKLAIPGNEPVDVSDGRLANLRLQVEAQLKPVLRDRDFADFDLDRAFASVAALAAALA
jgi:predicted nucleotidyltransferase component of viral defense system